MAAAQEHEIEFVDLVCVNLYPFEAWASRRGVTEHEVLEHIDIGGPTMIRAAAKNFAFTAVVVKPESYDAVLQELRDGDHQLSLPTRENLAAEAFAYTARYDTAISRWFAEKQGDFPEVMMSAYEKVTDLSYGENPHQRAAYYSQVGARMHVLSQVRQLGGKELSFNNVLDINSGPPAGRPSSRSRRARSSSTTTRAGRPSAARRSRPTGARSRATRCRRSAASSASTGRSTPSSRPRCSSSSRRSCSRPSSPTTRSTRSSTKPNLRILEDDERRRMNISEWDVKRVMGGLLVQDRDMDLEDRSEMEVVTDRKPSEARVGRDAVRLEGLQARALERDRAGAATSRRWASAPGR